MEVLYWLFEAGASFIEVYMLLILSRVIIGKQDIESKKVIEFMIAICVSIITILLNQIQLFSVFNFAIELVLVVCAQKFLLKRKIFTCFIVVLGYIVLLALIEYFVLIYLESLYALDAGALLELRYERLIAIALSKGILILVIEITCFILNREPQIKIRKSKGIVLCLIVVSLFPLGLLMDYSKYGYVSSNSFLGICMSIASVIIFVKYIIRDTERYQQETALKVQEAKNEVLEVSIQELERSFSMWKTSVHDYKHSILYMEMLLENNRINELKEYLVQEDSKLASSSHYYKTGNPMLDVMINTKAKVMRDKNIDFSVDITIEGVLSVKDNDLGILLGNLLDNAIEAAEESQRPYIILIVDYAERMLEIEVINSYNGIGNVDFKTTKEDAEFHGIGLQSVGKIVEKYNGQISRILEEEEVIINVLLL